MVERVAATVEVARVEARVEVEAVAAVAAAVWVEAAVAAAGRVEAAKEGEEAAGVMVVFSTPSKNSSCW